jgi:hypothetical protein
MSSNPPTPPAPTQPFWTSKTFWTLVIGFVINLVAMVKPGTISTEVQTIGTMILTILGIVFRWTASGPLAAS